MGKQPDELDEILSIILFPGSDSDSEGYTPDEAKQRLNAYVDKAVREVLSGLIENAKKHGRKHFIPIIDVEVAIKALESEGKNG